jgi:hypothetical protein
VAKAVMAQDRCKKVEIYSKATASQRPQ